MMRMVLTGGDWYKPSSEARQVSYLGRACARMTARDFACNYGVCPTTRPINAPTHLPEGFPEAFRVICRPVCY
jgi:hypothetical protein